MLRRIDLTPANRPVLIQPDEKLLQEQDNIGLYEGKYKIPEYQNGCGYLTSHRFCYVDNLNPKSHAIALDLKDVLKVEFYAGFLKSSPKITLRLESSPPDTPNVGNANFPNSARNSQLFPESPRASTPKPQVNWICPICSFSNPIPENFTPGAAASSAVVPCITCGVRPQATVLEKAYLDKMSTLKITSSGRATPLTNAEGEGNPCPRCTFHNHPSLNQCEMCGEPIVPAIPIRSQTDSPAPTALSAKVNIPLEVVKISFRQGGEKEFYKKLNDALVQRKWILKNAPPVPKPGVLAKGKEEVRNVVGIAGLERRGVSVRKENEAVMATAFEDLETLMAKAKDLIQVAERFSQSFPDAAPTALSLSSSALSLSTGVTESSSSTYHQSLARQVTDFLLAPVRGSKPPRSFLATQGGTLTLVDLYAAFNRSRGYDLISPLDLSKATQLFSTLNLPVRLKKFRKSGLVVVQDADESDDKIERRILGVVRDGSKWGRGVGVKEIAERFGWSLGVAIEELEMCEERGGLCREGGVEGVKFWENHILPSKARAIMGT